MSGFRKNIIWLASYPKSGNTWVRIFLNNILGNLEENINPDTLEGIPIASNRFLIDRYLGVPSADLTDQEIYDLRPDVYREISAHSDGIQVFKVHDAFGFTSGGEPLFPPEITKAVVYIIRNPLDIAVSYAFHSNCSFEDSVRRMNNSSYAISRNDDQLKAQVAQYLGTWSDHVKSWIRQNIHPVHIIRYEDLSSDVNKVFSGLLDNLDLETDKSTFNIALEKSDFKYLQSNEREHGFKEKPIQSELFFREGKANIFSQYLSADQIIAVEAAHGDLMKIFGYVT